MGPGNAQRTSAESVLKQLQQNPDAWQRVDTILETSQSQQSKFFAMQVSLGFRAQLQSLLGIWTACPPTPVHMGRPSHSTYVVMGNTPGAHGA